MAHRIVLGIGILFLLAGSAIAEEPTSATDSEAGAALTAFTKAWRDKAIPSRVAAIEALGAVSHPKVADKLLKTAGKYDDDEIKTAAYAALAGQAPASKKLLKKLEGILFAELKAEEKRIRKGKYNFVVDGSTGEADTTSPEGLRILGITKARGKRIQAILASFATLAPEPPAKAERLALFLQDPLDELVITTLEALTAWKEKDALKDVLALFRMYPTDWRYETGEVYQGGGTDASAKVEWMARFGHPDKRRTRPEIVVAIHEALKGLTGQDHEDPEALEAWMKANGIRLPR